MTVPVLVPWAENVVTASHPIAPRAVALEGATIGIVDNGWHCMHVLTEELTSALTETYGVAEVVVKHTSGSLTMTPAERADLLQRCQAVVIGIGTCGSCTRWVLQDAVELERAGLPTVSLYTEAFALLASTLAEMDGMTGVPRVVLPHPLNPLPDDEIRAAARSSMEQMLGALVQPGGLLAASAA